MKCNFLRVILAEKREQIVVEIESPKGRKISGAAVFILHWSCYWNKEGSSESRSCGIASDGTGRAGNTAETSLESLKCELC